MDCRLVVINILSSIFPLQSLLCLFYSQFLVKQKVDEPWLKLSPICEMKTKAHGDEVYKFRCSIFHFQRCPTTYSRTNFYFL
jgi:hypothetical protein